MSPPRRLPFNQTEVPNIAWSIRIVAVRVGEAESTRKERWYQW
jgi:hypothetical protein